MAQDHEIDKTFKQVIEKLIIDIHSSEQKKKQTSGPNGN